MNLQLVTAQEIAFFSERWLGSGGEALDVALTLVIILSFISSDAWPNKVGSWKHSRSQQVDDEVQKALDFKVAR